VKFSQAVCKLLAHDNTHGHAHTHTGGQLQNSMPSAANRQ